jgi:polyisoprenoid-binding protein YceI
MTAIAARHVSPVLAPGRWEVDPGHSTLEFRVRHAGLARVRGVFEAFEGALEVGPDGTLSAHGRVAAASLTTGLEARDGHLRSEDFFDVERHPHLAFSSTAITVGSHGALTVRGDLAIRGTTREIELRGEIVGTGRDDENAERVGLELATTIDRRDFGLTWNAAIDGGGLLVGNRVDLALEISAIWYGSA